MPIARRDFLAGVAAVSAAGALPIRMFAASSPFRVSVINDEISQDFEHACDIASREFGLHWIELRSMWKKNVVNLDEKEIAEAKRIVDKHGLKVTDIASPLFKTDWPGAPKSKMREGGGFGADFGFDQQDEVLDRAMNLARTFQTDRVRCFDFWRLEDQAPHRKAMNDRLLKAANRAGEKGITLILENESSCNTATGAESAKLLEAVKSDHFMLNWDPGNAAAAGENPYPGPYDALPKDRIGHCHCKDVVKIGKGDWAPMGGGVIDWLGQFKALKRDGFHFAVSLETHWRGAGSEEASTRQSWAGMKKLLQQADAL